MGFSEGPSGEETVHGGSSYPVADWLATNHFFFSPFFLLFHISMNLLVEDSCAMGDLPKTSSMSCIVKPRRSPKCMVLLSTRNISTIFV